MRRKPGAAQQKNSPRQRPRTPPAKAAELSIHANLTLMSRLGQRDLAIRNWSLGRLPSIPKGLQQSKRRDFPSSDRWRSVNRPPIQGADFSAARMASRGLTPSSSQHTEWH